jgi:hypothetical protein
MPYETNRPFCHCLYNGRPAVYDRASHVYYMGFKSMKLAANRAYELNQESESEARRNLNQESNQNRNQESSR